MNDIIKGHAEKVPSSDLMVDDGKRKDKIRIVFDCSAKFQGTAPNDHLLQGPDLTNTLVGVLFRFRHRTFHQFRVNVEDRNYLRFLWWENENYCSDPIEYRMCVHLFGAASSRGCANFGLKHVADDHEGEFGTSAANVIGRNFYVDDGLKSVPTQAEAIVVIKKTTDMCTKGVLHLHKFTSNSKEVLDQIPQEDLAKEIKDLDLLHDKLPVERALIKHSVVYWIWYFSIHNSSEWSSSDKAWNIVNDQFSIWSSWLSSTGSTAVYVQTEGRLGYPFVSRSETAMGALAWGLALRWQASGQMYENKGFWQSDSCAASPLFWCQYCWLRSVLISEISGWWTESSLFTNHWKV